MTTASGRDQVCPACNGVGDGPYCLTCKDTGYVTDYSCRFCGGRISRNDNGDWIDNVGEAYCEIRVSACRACDDGEPHPHAPDAAVTTMA